ncbi:MAG: zinc-dependent alcohol dehydrogenase family protein [Proteobacteria bacterium]|nr:zinc-dependent alcohol dehydrogenase family protein [Pseudomonadota bacterium]
MNAQEQIASPAVVRYRRRRSEQTRFGAGVVMKVAQYSTHGRPAEVVTLVDQDTGEPGPGELVIDVEAAPVHIADLKNLAGEPGFRVPLPATPGYEGIGRISVIGSGVTDFAIGDRVFLPIRCGAWREQIRVAAAEVFPAPEGDAVQLSLLSINAPTAELILRDFGDLKAGDWVIQNAANSNCGTYLIKLADMRGIKTVNVVRRESLIAELKSYGADVVLVDGPDLATRVKQESGGADIRLGIDAVCGDATTRIGECLADGGTILAYGLLSGEPCKIPSALLFFHDIRLRGFFMSRQLLKRSRAEQLELYAGLAHLIADGTLRARIAGTYPLEEVAQAVAHAGKVGDERPGKIILLPD